LKDCREDTYQVTSCRPLDTKIVSVGQLFCVVSPITPLVKDTIFFHVAFIDISTQLITNAQKLRSLIPITMNGSHACAS